ncbi:hypothetical protein GOP47_0020740 [Adiantum capillus-veneris]|uniref:Uncharacterized protein n=1 Tax=Adiantum capillus-veneris TaxID=13818 RepID=A0A9D4U9Z0_ADICA|nr:hypothetical protein GOP47_0020740 [Adiantum capillus-veneris]
MGFTSFVGRVLFSAIFIFAAWHKVTDFGQDGGSALKAMTPKVDLLRNHITSFGVSPPEVELKYLLMAAIALEGVGGILFTLGTSLGAYLLIIFLTFVTPIMHDFYNYDISSREYVTEFTQFLKNLSLLGGLLFFLGMKNYAAKKSKKKVVKPKTN